MSANRIKGKVDVRTHSTLVKSEPDVCPELKSIIERTRKLMTDYIVRRKDLKSKSGRGISTSFLDEAQGVFPPSFPIGRRAVGFSANEIDAWIAARSFSACSKTPVDMKAFITLLVKSRNQVTSKSFEE